MNDLDIIAASRAAFFEEARDMLAQLESSLLALGTDNDAEALGAAFRAAHTIKGSSGLFGYTAVVAFTHEVETVLDAMRDGQIRVTDQLVTLLLQTRDQIERLVEVVASPEVPADVLDEGARLIGLLKQVMERPAQEGVLHSSEPVPLAVPADNLAHGDPQMPTKQSQLSASRSLQPRTGCWHISLRFKSEALRNGLDPLSFLRYLPTVGEIRSLVTVTDRIPHLDAIDPEQCYLGFEIQLNTAADKTTIEKVFEFAFDDCDLRILPPQTAIDDYLTTLLHDGEDRQRLGRLLVEAGAITERELAEALTEQKTGNLLLIGEVLQQQGAASNDVVQAAVGRQQQLGERKAEESRFVRVPAEKLDTLIDLIGELVIAGSGARLVATQEKSPRFAEAALRICHLVEAARDGALQLRMVQIGDTFTRFRRVVRDVSEQLGKQIELEMIGGETELDKSMVERIADPLMHLVRNSLDHGIEPPQQRLDAGKSAVGRLALNAYHDSGSIVIEVSDDGRGLDRERILAKGIERGLVKAGQSLTEQEILQLIFLPGFSTAAAITDISGRGVGMDVVKRNIEALRGQVHLATQPGRGTTVQIRLPLTLAIIDGFLVAVGNAHYIVPLEMVVECIETPPEALTAHKSMTGYFNLRGEVLPFIALHTMFGMERNEALRQSVIVVKYGNAKVGLVVDRLMGEYQTVIKPLGRLFSALRGIAGSTILGSGEVALILDVPALVDTVSLQRGLSASLPIGLNPLSALLQASAEQGG